MILVIGLIALLGLILAFFMVSDKFSHEVLITLSLFLTICVLCVVQHYQPKPVLFDNILVQMQNLSMYPITIALSRSVEKDTLYITVREQPQHRYQIPAELDTVPQTK